MVEQAQTKAGFKAPPSIGAAFALVIQIIVAIVLFSIISAAAVFLNWITALCEGGSLAPQWVIWGMRGLEFVLWAADVLCFLLLIVVEVKKFCVAVWNGRHV